MLCLSSIDWADNWQVHQQLATTLAARGDRGGRRSAARLTLKSSLDRVEPRLEICDLPSQLIDALF